MARAVDTAAAPRTHGHPTARSANRVRTISCAIGNAKRVQARQFDLGGLRGRSCLSFWAAFWAVFHART